MTQKWSGYGLAFGIKDYLHKKSGKNAKNLIILGADTSDDDKTTENSIIVLGKGSVSITRTETIEAKEEIKTNCTITNKKFVLLLHIMLVMIIVRVICLLIILNNTILKQIKMKLNQESYVWEVF